MSVKKKDVLQNDKSLKWKWLSSMGVLLICIISDFITIYTFSGEIFNESPWLSYIVSGVSALCLDVSLAYAAVLLNQCRSNSPRASRRRCRILAGLMFAVFVLAYIGLILLAFSDSIRNNPDLIESGTATRLILPTATSILSFVISLDVDPEAIRVAQVNRQLAKLNEQLAEETATANRLSDTFEKFDPDCYDEQRLQLAIARLKAVSLKEECEVDILKVKELGGAAAETNKILQENAKEAIILCQEIEELGLGLNVAPTPEHQAGAIPDFTRTQATSQATSKFHTLAS